jgi:hypothetical protein
MESSMACAHLGMTWEILISVNLKSRRPNLTDALSYPSALIPPSTSRRQFPFGTIFPSNVFKRDEEESQQFIQAKVT